MKKKFKVVGSLTWFQRIVLIILPILVVILAMGIGRMVISPVEVLKSTFEKFGYDYSVNPQNEIVLWTIRFPRIILALLVGAGLSVAGCAFQSLFSNPLATPDTLGVASGTSFGAALGILMGFSLIGIQFSALLFGIIAVSLTYLSGTGKGHSINTIVLAGIMIGSLFSALVSFTKFVADSESASYKTLMLGAPFIIVGIFILYLLRWRLNILMLSEDEAKSSGTNIKLLRTITIIAATMMTGSCVSMCGQVGWVGLIIPHMCRMKFGNNHLSLIPASISIGAVFMVIVDTIARSLVATEIPISILTAIVGAPFFITLMRRSGGWKL